MGADLPTNPSLPTVVYNVGDEAQLRTAIENANANAAGIANYQIVLGSAAHPATIVLSADLPLLALTGGSDLTIQGNGFTIDGGGTYRGLFAYEGVTEIDNLNLSNTVAHGGAGGDVAHNVNNGVVGGAGGGGAGLGGGLFVASGASVTIDNVNFFYTAAIGGVGGSQSHTTTDGGTGGGGGGGGLGGAGGFAVNGTGGGGGGGGIGVGANGSTDWYTARDGAAGSAVGLGSAGGGGWTEHTNHYAVFSTTDYSHGGGGGGNGGAGGDGYSIGGGGGGIGGQTVPSFYTGSSGFSLSLNWSPAGLALDLLTLADVIAPEFAFAATVVLGLYGAIGGQLGAPGFLNQADFTLDGDGFHRDPGGSNIPGLSKIFSKLTSGQIKYLFGFGVHVDYMQNGPGGNPPAGGDGGFGGGGGGGGQSQGGWGGFGGGGGGYVAAGKYSGPGAPGFGAGATTGLNGGGGLGAGGAIFVQDGGSLTYAGSGVMTGQSAQGGLGGGYLASAGSGYGQGVFLQGGSTLNLAPAVGQSITIGAIADQAGSDPAYAPSPSAPGQAPPTTPSSGGAVEGSVVENGPGTVILTGVNTYLGGTTLQAGKLELKPGASLAGPVTVNGGLLQADTGASLKGVTSLYLVGGQVNVASGVSLTGITSVYEEGGSLTLGAGDVLSGDIHIVNDTAPVITINMGAGATFTGGVYGLASNQYVRFTQVLGGDGIPSAEASNYGADPLHADQSALIGSNFVYRVETRANGAWVTDARTVNPGDGQQTFTLSNDQQLADLLQWIAYNDYDQYARSTIHGLLTINLAPGATVNGGAQSSYLVGAQGSGVVIDASGQLADGGGASLTTSATISGGNILLETSTVTLEAAVGQSLVVSSNIVQAFGNDLGPINLTIGSAGAAGSVVLSGVNTFKGGLNFAGGTLELTSVQAGGNGAINFVGGNHLKVDGAFLPQNTFNGFAYGDTLDLAGVSLPSGIMLLNRSGKLVFNPTTGLALNFGGLPTGFAFTLSSDGGGGTAITALQQPQTATSTAQLVSELGSLGTDTYIALANGVPQSFSLSQGALALAPASGGVVIIDGGGRTLDGGGVPTGVSLAAGAAVLRNLTINGFTQTPLSVGSGARIDLQSVTLGGFAQVAAGGVLAIEAGTIGAVNASGTFAAAPAVGATVNLNGQIIGNLAVGDIGGTFPEPPVLTGGVVVAQASARVSGAVYLDTDTTLELQSGVTLGGAPIVFNSPEGARLKIDGLVLPSNLISFAVGACQIDLARVSITGPHLVTVQTGDSLTLPNANGRLNFGAGVSVGETFLATSDGAGGTLLTPMVQGSTVSTELQFEALGPYIAALPSGGAPNGQNLLYTAGLSGIIEISGSGEGIAAPSGVSASLTDAGQPGGFVLDSGVSFSLAGTNTFSGGVTLDASTTLTASSAAALGTGPLDINGASVTLTVGGSAPIANVINDFAASDTINLSGVTALQSGYVYTTANGVATFSTASGSYSLTLGDLPIDTPVYVQSRGAAGTVITTVGRQTLTVTTEAQLDAAMTSADAFQGQTVINIANGATISLTRVLPGVNLAANQSLVINGHGGTIDGQGAQGGFYVAAGQVAIDDLSLVNLLAQGGAGQSDAWAGGGGAGLGGALFVGAAATVNLTTVSFSGDKAVGGAGGAGTSNPNDGSGGAGDVNTAAAGVLGHGGAGNGGVGFGGEFGGGGGAENGPGGFGGGGGDSNGEGGGGAGLGGAIFIQQGGSLVIGGSLNEGGDQAVGGAGSFRSASGLGLGAAIFSQGASALTFAPAAGQTNDIAGQIADTVGNGGAGGSLSITLAGAGVLELDGANSYSGTTTIQSGTLLLTGSMLGLAGGIVDNSLLKLQEVADTTYTGALTGTGSLILASGAVDTFAGSLNIAGTVTVQSGTLNFTGTSISAASINLTGALAFAGGNSLTVASRISGSGAIIYDDTGAVTLSNVNSTGALTIEAGVLALSGANAFSSITLDGGALDLMAPLGGATSVAFASGVNSRLIVEAGVAPPATITGFTFGDSLDIKGQVFVSETLLAGNILRLTTASGATTDITIDPGVNLSSDAYDNSQSTVFNPQSDGNGGTLVSPVPAQRMIASQADLNSAIASFSVGGAAYHPDFNYGLNTGGRFITVDAQIPVVNLGAGSSIYINDGFYLSDQNGQGGNPVFRIQSGAVTINASGGQQFGSVGVGLEIDPGASLTVLSNSGHNFLGYNSPYGVTDNGLLSLSGGQLIYGLQGSGQLVLNNGNFQFQLGDSADLSFAGALTLNNASINGIVSGLRSLTLGTNASIWVNTLPTTVTFQPGVADQLEVNQLSGGGNSTIYGFTAADSIYLARTISSADSAYVLKSGTAVLGPGNVLTVTLWEGSNSGPTKTATIQFDPNQDFTGYVFGVTDQLTLSLQPTHYTAYTGGQLAADISAIGQYQAGAPNTAYTITLGADLTGAAAGAGKTSGISLASGSTLTIDGAGHTVSGVGFSAYDAHVTLKNLTLENTSGFFDSIGSTNSADSSLTLDNVNILGGTLATSSLINGQGMPITLSASAGQTTTIAAAITGGNVIVDGPGTVKLSGANSFLDGINLNGGVLELASSHAAGAGYNVSTYGRNVGTITLGADAEIVVDSSVAMTAVYGLAAGVGEIDFKTIAPTAISIARVAVYKGSPTFPNSDYQPWVIDSHAPGGASFHPLYEDVVGGQLVLDGVTGPLVVASDGSGGTIIRVAKTTFAATDEASLNVVLASLNLSGAQSAPGAADTINLGPPGGVLTLNSPVQPVALAAGASLTIQGGGSTINGNGGTQSGLVFSSGQFTVNNLNVSDFTPNQTALTVGAAASVTLTGVNFTDGQSTAPVVDVLAGGALTIQGGAFSAGSAIELQQGSTLTLGTAGGATFTLGAAIDDPAGDGAGSGQASVTVAGSVVLTGQSDVSGGMTVTGTAELAGDGAAGSGPVTIASHGKIIVESQPCWRVAEHARPHRRRRGRDPGLRRRADPGAGQRAGDAQSRRLPRGRRRLVDDYDRRHLRGRRRHLAGRFRPDWRRAFRLRSLDPGAGPERPPHRDRHRHNGRSILANRELRLLQPGRQPRDGGRSGHGADGERHGLHLRPPVRSGRPEPRRRPRRRHAVGRHRATEPRPRRRRLRRSPRLSGDRLGRGPHLPDRFGIRRRRGLRRDPAGSERSGGGRRQRLRHPEPDVARRGGQRPRRYGPRRRQRQCDRDVLCQRGRATPQPHQLRRRPRG
jgi:fibronectin-binding autotransporter adhesin